MASVARGDGGTRETGARLRTQVTWPFGDPWGVGLAILVDIDVIIHIHLHNDHCENDYKCTNARVYVQKRGYDFFKTHPVDHRYFPDLLDDNEVVLLDGDQEVLDGISVLLTPGHTVGGQSIVVNTKKGPAVITGFCCNGRTSRPPAPSSPPASTSTSWTPTTAPKRSKRSPTFSSPSTTLASAATATSRINGHIEVRVRQLRIY